MVCDCLVELSHIYIDKTFTYKIKDDDLDKIKIGMRVLVPFGKQVLNGFVLNIRENDEEISLREVIRVIDSYPVLNDELLRLGYFIKDNTMCSLINAYQAMLPTGFKAKVRVNYSPLYEKYICLNDVDINSIKLSSKQREIVLFVNKNKCVLKRDLDKISRSGVKTLLDRGVLLLESKEVYRFNLDKEDKVSYDLNDDQKRVYDEIVSDLSNVVYLLYGVTGSGKTNVYMDVIKKVISEGKKAIFLVPEISLTPQIIKRFAQKFDNIAVFHSGLSDGEKYDEWRRIREGKVDIVIGARSAIFAPLDNIGVIIIDEEHSSTYKQDISPRYDAISVAKERCKYNNCALILGSATPSLESYSRGIKGVYKLLTLDKRYNNNFPKIELIDMNKEFRRNNSYFSQRVLMELQSTIDRGEQAIVFLNRRGYSSYITCRECGKSVRCPNCDISLTYHKSSNMLRCHYCGYAEVKEDNCKYCHNKLVDYGIGTEKVEEELLKLIKNSRVIRMDVDTTSRKGSYKKIINEFSLGNYNILVGTQMISKGLDFPNVTLVCVINADSSLNIPDFRSSENTFQLLSQVSGRSGRSDKGGKVLIQTFNTDFYVMRCIKDNDYVSFYNEEMSIRRRLKYPPYYFICEIKVISIDYNLASKTSLHISKYLKDNVNNCIILGPSICNMFKVNNKYHFQIIIKYKNINDVKKYIFNIYSHYFNDRKVKVEINFNPK